jgi:hypothetical protein
MADRTVYSAYTSPHGIRDFKEAMGRIHHPGDGPTERELAGHVAAALAELIHRLEHAKGSLLAETTGPRGPA